MTKAEFLRVVERHPFLREWLAGGGQEEAMRFAERVVVEEKTPVEAPELPDAAPEWEKAYWRRRKTRVIGTCDCGRPIVRGTGNTATKCGRCATKGLDYVDGL